MLCCNNIVFLGGEAPIEFFDFQEVLPRTLTKQFGSTNTYSFNFFSLFFNYWLQHHNCICLTCSHLSQVLCILHWSTGSMAPACPCLTSLQKAFAISPPDKRKQWPSCISRAIAYELPSFSSFVTQNNHRLEDASNFLVSFNKTTGEVSWLFVICEAAVICPT